jgi:putative membrane protein
MEKISENKLRNVKRWIIVLSIVIPIAIAALFGIKIEGYNTSFLPPIYATINGITAIILLIALWAILFKKDRELHRKLMRLAILCSILFLIGYITYHITSSATIYGDINHDGKRSVEEIAAVKNSFLIYVLLLISHIILSVAVVPLVLFTYLQAYLGKFDRHKKLARYTFPIWLFVAISGVVVYLMISPYYVK